MLIARAVRRRICGQTLFSLAMLLAASTAAAQSAPPPATNEVAPITVTVQPLVPVTTQQTAPRPPLGTYQEVNPAYAYAPRREVFLSPGMRWRTRDPLPPGWHLGSRRSHSQIVGGSILFVVPWALTSYVALSSRGAEWFAIPVFGPIAGGVAVFASIASGSCSGGWCGIIGFIGVIAGMLLIVDGLAQAAGLVLAGLGVFRPRVTLEPDDPRLARERRQRLRWAVVPTAPGAPLGASFALFGF